MVTENVDKYTFGTVLRCCKVAVIMTHIYWPFSTTSWVSRYQNFCIPDFNVPKDDGGGEWWQLELWDVQSSTQTHQQTITQLLQAGCPFCRRTNSVWALKGESITLRGLAHVGHLPLLFWPLKAPDYFGGGLPSLLSDLYDVSTPAARLLL